MEYNLDQQSRLHQAGQADVGVLSSQLIWHSLEVSNVQVALDILELWQRPSPGPAGAAMATPPLLPPAVLRAVLVACDHSGHEEKARALFQQLKRRRVYNAEPLGSSPHVFCLSTMLTPAEISFCILDRLKELHAKLCGRVKAGQRLCSLGRGLGVQVVGEHSPQALALPFLALAPRSCPQALGVVVRELGRLDPPLLPAPHQPVKVELVMVDPASLVAHLKSYDTPGLKQGLVWEDELPPPQQPTLPPQSKSSSSSSFQRPPLLPVSYQSGAGVGRQLSVPPPPSPPPKSHEPMGRQLSVPAHPASKPGVSVGRRSPVARASASRSSPCTQGPGDWDWRESQPMFPSFPVPVDSVGRHIPAPQTAAAAAHLSSRPGGDPAGRQQGTFPPAQPPFHHQPVSPVGKRVPGSANVTSSSSPPGRQPFVPPSAGRSEPPQQPRREMKRRLTAPAPVPEHQQPASLHKTPLLPNPQLSPPSTQPGGTLSKPTSPKRMKASSPQGQGFLAGRPVEESHPPRRQQQRPHSSTSSPLDPQLPLSANSRQSQQSSPRGRGMAHSFSRNKDRSQFQGFATRGRGNPSGHSRKGAGRMRSQFTQRRRGHSPKPNSQSFGQHLPQQFPGETRQMPITSVLRDRERAPTQSFQASQSLPPQQFPGETRQMPITSVLRDRERAPTQSFQASQSLPPQQFPGETRQMPITSVLRDRERAPTQSFQASQSLPPQTSEHMGWNHPGEKRSPLACCEAEQFAEGPDFLPQQSTQHRSRQSSRQNAPRSVPSQQHFPAEVGDLPNFPPRVHEQMSKSQTPMRQRVGTMEEGSERMDQSWQGSGSRYKQQQQQQPRVEPWGDAPPPHEQGEDFSWRSRQLEEQAAQPFSLPASSTGPFRQQDSYREPARQQDPMEKLAPRERGGPSFRSRPNWRRPYRGRGFRGNFGKN